jgi:hypothetical protein
MNSYLVFPIFSIVLLLGENIIHRNSITNSLSLVQNRASNFSLETGEYRLFVNKKDGIFNSASVIKTNKTFRIDFTMFWGGGASYTIYQIKGNILKAKTQIEENEYDTLTIKVLSPKSFKVIDATYNWGVDFPYIYNETYIRNK